MKRILLYLFFLSISHSCHKPTTTIKPATVVVEIDSTNPQKQEVEAIIVRFDYNKHICGFSWIIQVGAKQYRAKTIPEPFQKENQSVWIKYNEVPNDRANCGFIVLTSIRVR